MINGGRERLTIEASAALAEWIDLCRAEAGARLYTVLVDRAVNYLPMPTRTARPTGGPFAALADRELATRLVEACDPERVTRVRAGAERHPSQVFANALVNTAWRNGPVESIHAGHAQGYPLMRFASDGMARGMTVCRQLAMEHPGRPWPEQVLPYGLATMMPVTPRGWTLTKTSCDVRLPAPPGIHPARSGG